MSIVKGFSIIELLVVVAIIAILSAVAAPAYGTYVIKARVTELLTVANSYKAKLIERLYLPQATEQSVFTINSASIDHITMQTIPGEPVKHVIEVVAKMQTDQHNGIGLKQSSVSNKPLFIQLQGVEAGDIINWSCHVAAEYNNYVPNICHNNEIEIL